MADYESIVNTLWETSDSDKNGTLDLPETEAFFNDLASKREDLSLTDHAAWFANIDKDSDGTVSREEMASYLASINYTQ